MKIFRFYLIWMKRIASQELLEMATIGIETILSWHFLFCSSHLQNLVSAFNEAPCIFDWINGWLTWCNIVFLYATILLQYFEVRKLITLKIWIFSHVAHISIKIRKITPKNLNSSVFPAYFSNILSITKKNLVTQYWANIEFSFEIF